MDLIFYVAVLAPVIIAAAVMVLLRESITPLEALVQAIIPALIVSLVWWAGRYGSTGDYELWNGELTRKITQQEYCQTGWRDYTDNFCTEYRTRQVRDGETCTTYTDSNGKSRRSCTPKYKTQYKYIYSWERKYWLDTNVRETYYIPRVDPQGAYEPPRYTQAFVGEPVAAAKSYTNWLRGASNSIFHEDGKAEEKYQAILPQYPMKIYDYYNVDRIVTVGNVSKPGYLNDMLRVELKELGPKKQMNVVFVLVDSKIAGQDFPYAVRRFWQGFKKNDTVVFLGLDGDTLKWGQVMSWSKKSIFDVSLRDEINSRIDRPVDYVWILNRVTTLGKQHYERREMKEFEYLKSQIPVPTWLTIMALVLSVGGSIGLTALFHHIDLGGAFNTNRVRRYTR